MSKNKILIGIDAGVNTGYAKIENDVLCEVETLNIIQALRKVEEIIQSKTDDDYLKIYIEDARKRKWIPSKVGREVLQGVGSVKRDCGIWGEFCVEHNIDFELIPPKNNLTKLSREQFKKMTGWDKRTSEHARDATMLVWGRK